MSTAIEFENISKQYRLGLVSTGTLSHDLNRFWQTKVLRREDPYLKVGEVNDRTSKGKSDYVWALKDINFKVEEGDVVGIIGRNGAGKSTLLKLLSRVTAPTTGTIRARGRIASLLEVGTGFHPEMTGRENIYMNGAIMGMTRAEITRKLDEIVDFSGCERYLDTPVKRYSSGMTVRLGFAIAAHLEPEILVVDEVLAVGDAEFQKKAIGKMQDVSKGEGRTVLFVSHNMGAVKNLCKRGIVLKNGFIDYLGSASNCIDYYKNSNINDFSNEIVISKHHRRSLYSCEIEIFKIKILNDNSHISTNEPLYFEITLKSNLSKQKSFNIAFYINDSNDNRVGTALTKKISIDNSKEFWKFKIILKNHNLAKGKYNIDFNLTNFDFDAFGQNIDLVYNTVSFIVDSIGNYPKKQFLVWHPDMGGCCYTDTIVEEIT